MIEIADLVAVLTVESAGFDASMLRADAEMHGMRDTTASTMDTMRSFSLVLGGLALGGFALAVKSAIDYQKILGQVQSNTTMTAAGAEVMRTGILKLASESNAPLDQLATGFMHITNYGFSAKDSLVILQQAMMSATSTGGDTGKVAETLSNVLHEFGMNAGQAGNAMDVLHLAAAQGNMTLEQFVNASGKALSMAANLNVPLVDVAAAMSALTRHGIGAAQAGTMIQGALSKIITPAVSTTKELARLTAITGIDLTTDFTKAGIASKGLAGVLADVGRASQMTGENIFKLIPATRGGLAAMILTGNGTTDYKGILLSLNDAIAGRVHPTLDAYTRMQSTTAYQMGQLSNEAQVLAITIGSVLLPPLTDLLKDILPIVAAVESWANANPALFSDLVKGALAVTGFLLAFGASKAVIEMIAGLVSVLSDLWIPVLLVVGASAAFKKAWDTNFLGIKDALSPVLSALGTSLGAFATVVGDVFTGLTTGNWTNLGTDLLNLKNDLGLVATAVLAAITAIGSHFSWQGFQDFGTWLKTNLPTLGKDILVGVGFVIDKSVDLVKLVADFVATNGPKVLSAVGTAIGIGIHLVGVGLKIVGDLVATVAAFIATNGPKVLAAAGTAIGVGFSIVGDLVAAAVAFVEKYGPSVLSNIKATIHLGADLIGKVATAIGNEIPVTVKLVGDLVTLVRNWIATNGPKVLSTIGTAVGLAFHVVGDLVSAVVAFVKQYGPGVLHAVGADVQLGFQLVGDLVSAVAAFIKKNAPAAGKALQIDLSITFGAIANMADNVWKQLSAIGGPLISTITKWVSTNGPKIGAAFDGLLGAAFAWVENIPTELFKQLSGPNTGIAASFSNWVEAHKGDVEKAAAGLAYYAARWALDVGSKAAGILLDGTIGIPVMLAAAVVKMVPTIIRDLSSPSGRGSLLYAVSSWAGGASTLISNILLGIGAGGGKGIVDGLGDAFNNIGNATAIMLGLGGNHDMVTAVTKWAHDVPGHIYALLTGKVTSVASIEDEVGNASKGASDWLFSAGADLITGLMNGIKSMGSWFVSQFKQFILDHLPGLMAKVLESSSPSKVMALHGVNVVTGLMSGIDSQSANLDKTMRGIGGVLTNMSQPQRTGLMGISAQNRPQGAIHNHIYIEGKQVGETVFNYAARDRRMRPELVG